MTETRTRRKNHYREPLVEIGDSDPMSVLAAKWQMVLCGQQGMCTRAAGHTEDTGTAHVAAPLGVAILVWED